MRLLKRFYLVVILANTACTQNRLPDPSATSSVDAETVQSTPVASVVCGKIAEWSYLDDGESATVLMVHKDALIVDESGTYVSKVFDTTETSFVVDIPVKAGGVTAGEWVQIVPLLRAGDQVVIRADERLDSGREVDITKVVGGHPSRSKKD